MGFDATGTVMSIFGRSAMISDMYRVRAIIARKCGAFDSNVVMQLVSSWSLCFSEFFSERRVFFYYSYDHYSLFLWGSSVAVTQVSRVSVTSLFVPYDAAGFISSDLCYFVLLHTETVRTSKASKPVDAAQVSQYSWLVFLSDAYMFSGFGSMLVG